MKLARGRRLWTINNLDRDVKWPAGYCSRKKGGGVFSSRIIVFAHHFLWFHGRRQAGYGGEAGQAATPAQLLSTRPIVGQYLHVDMAA